MAKKSQGKVWIKVNNQVIIDTNKSLLNSFVYKLKVKYYKFNNNETYNNLYIIGYAVFPLTFSYCHHCYAVTLQVITAM